MKPAIFHPAADWTWQAESRHEVEAILHQMFLSRATVGEAQCDLQLLVTF